MIINSCQKGIVSNVKTAQNPVLTQKTAHSFEQTNCSNPFRVLPQGYAPINFKARAEDGFKPVPKALKEKMDKAEEIVCKVKNAYPSISPSKVMYTFNKKNFSSEQKAWLDKKQSELNSLRNDYCADTQLETVEGIFNSVKENKLANCFELAKMTQASLQANGIKDVNMVSLLGYTNPTWKQQHSLDHTFLVVNADIDDSQPWDKPKERYGKNAYVVDPWLGFVDTVENALKIYEKTWEKIPHYVGIKGYGFDYSYTSDLNSNEIKKFKQNHPELILTEPVNHKRFDK